MPRNTGPPPELVEPRQASRWSGHAHTRAAVATERTAYRGEDCLQNSSPGSTSLVPRGGGKGNVPCPRAVLDPDKPPDRICAAASTGSEVPFGAMGRTYVVGGAFLAFWRPGSAIGPRQTALFRVIWGEGAPISRSEAERQGPAKAPTPVPFRPQPRGVLPAQVRELTGAYRQWRPFAGIGASLLVISVSRRPHVTTIESRTLKLGLPAWSSDRMWKFSRLVKPKGFKTPPIGHVISLSQASME